MPSHRLTLILAQALDLTIVTQVFSYCQLPKGLLRFPFHNRFRLHGLGCHPHLRTRTRTPLPRLSFPIDFLPLLVVR